MAALLCCSATGCRLAGAGPLRRALGQARAVQDAGGTEPVAIKPVGCLRLCSAGPLVAVHRDDGSW
ncbi:MAG: (2Fe-2S) ferredoxin domain-containing protein, partial [Cyanobacteria bacterium REEB417]|nr:(2Fe-2S) ferredoxin domain-containing protein [Cyanobacteria bacterium REEB417]